MAADGNQRSLRRFALSDWLVILQAVAIIGGGGAYVGVMSTRIDALTVAISRLARSFEVHVETQSDNMIELRERVSLVEERVRVNSEARKKR